MAASETRPMIELTLRVANSISDVAAQAWDACANPAASETGNGPASATCAPTADVQVSVLGDRHNPFISHAFLSALELLQSVRPRTGWQPIPHLAAGGQCPLLGGVPSYV